MLLTKIKYLLNLNIVITVAFAMVFYSYSFAQQTCPPFSANVVQIAYDQNNCLGNQIDNVGCKEVRLLPGYHFAAGANKFMHTFINPYGNCDIDYGQGYSSSNPPSINPSYEVGTTPGSFAVTQTGAATYSIPLTLPPGSAGVQPSLSIAYSSQGGDGLLGIGWSLAGLSSISRTGKTLYHDNAVAGVQLNNNDRFVLDGNRLFVVTGNYGHDNSIYATEMESFSRITAYNPGVTDEGPKWFIVEAKDGSTLEFGNSPDSRIEASGGSSTVLTWLLNKVIDPTGGNYFKIHYIENNGNGTFRPDFIEYTGNDAAGIAPYNTIKFVYGTRQDKQEYWVAGHNVQQNVLLTAIEIYAQNNLAHKYEFNYSYSMGSHLSEVIEKGTDGKQFNSTKIIWEDPIDINPSVTSFPSSLASAELSYVLDVNGDGFTDIAYTDGDYETWYTLTNDQNGNFSQTGTTNITVFEDPSVVQIDNLANVASLDFTGDGYDDLIVMELNKNEEDFRMHFLKSVPVSGGRKLAVDNLNEFSFHYEADDKAKFKYAFGDFDGDGATDAFIYFYDADEGYFHSFRNSTNSLVLHDIGDRDLSFYTTDLNGDGKHEVLYTFNNPWTNTSYSEVLEYNGTNFSAVSGTLGYPTGYHKVFPGDFNGDGKTDILTWSDPNQGGSGWFIGYSQGNQHDFIASPAGMQSFGDPTDPSTFHEYIVADLNGDGKADIYDKGIQGGFGPTFLEARYSTGTDFITGGISLPGAFESISGSSLGDFDGDGRMEVIVKTVANQFSQVKFMPGNDIHKAQQIINGFGYTTRINYNTLPLLAKQGKYIMGTDLVTPLIPVIHFQKALTAVWRTEADNGIGGTNASEYAYEGAKVHLQGKGLLGFANVKTFDLSSGITQENTYEMGISWLNSNRFQPALTNSKSYLTSTKQLINEQTIALTDYKFITANSTPPLPLPDLSGMRYHFFAKKITSIDYLHGNTTITDIQQDGNGNVTYQKIDNGTEITETNNTFCQENCTWLPAHLCSTQATVTRGADTYTRSRTIQNDGIGCKTRKIFDDTGVISEWFYSAPVGIPIIYGVQSDLPTYAASYDYDSKKRFVTKETRNLNFSPLVTETAYDDAYGNILSQKDPNNLVTSYIYDGFGRLQETTTTTGQELTVNRSWELGTFPNSIYAITTSQAGTPTVKEYYDLLGRIIRTETQGFDGSTIFVERTYNNMGQLLKETAPNDNTLFTEYQYETDFKRLKRVITPNNSQNPYAWRITNYAYTYFTNETTITTQLPFLLSRTAKRKQDASGLLIEAEDEGGKILYEYHANGKPKKITSPDGVVTTMTYDNFGRQQTLNDPNAGPMAYTYYQNGLLKTQTDNTGNIYTMTYDALGRMKTKTGTEGTVTYNYDTKPNGKGMIGTITGFNSINCEYSYDSQSRLASKTEQNLVGQNYAFAYQYDNLNRITQITYPSGFAVKRNYNNTGYLEKITDANSQLFWQCNTMNERLQVTSAFQGNGGTISKTYTNLGFLQNISRIENNALAMNWNFSFNPATGNLNQRGNILKGLTETFTYDKLDRLTKINPVTFSAPVTDIAYLPSGNILSKTDVGDYDYSSLKPHTVAQINNPILEMQNLPQQDITYTSFHKAEKINEGNFELQFIYGYDYQRRISELKNSGNTERKIIYVGDYEKITDANNNSYEVHYIAGSDGLAAMAVKQNGGQEQIYYVHTDHLGSIIALYDASGNKVYEQNFDAWGRERNPNDWTYTPNSLLPTPDWLIRGFTGHEHHKEFGLINMNGRMYDPLMGRMLSPDNYVQSADFTQTFNRYSYALNNPLVYTDPDGEWIQLVIGGIIGGYSGYKLGQAMGITGLELVGYTLGGAAIGAISGGIGSAIATGGGIAANTMGIVASSFTNSAGMFWMSGGRTDLSVGFGAGSYNFSSGELGYLGKKGNSNVENFGYGLGALGNVSDVLAGFHPGEVQLNTEHSDAIGHSAITKVGETDPHNSIVSVGPDPGGKWIFNPFKFNKGTNNWKNYVDAGDDVWKNTVKGVNVNTLSKYGAHFNKGINYNLYLSSCVNHTARALTLSGVPVIGIHPFILNAQIYLRAIGVRPVLYSYYLTK